MSPSVFPSISIQIMPSVTWVQRAAVWREPLEVQRTSPASDTLEIRAPPNVLPNAASSSAILWRRGSRTQPSVKSTSMNLTRLSSPSVSRVSSLSASRSTTAYAPAAPSTETRLRAIRTASSSGSRHAAPGNSLLSIDHEHEDPEFLLHHRRQAQRRHRLEIQFRHEPLAGIHRVLEPGQPVQTKRAPHQRRPSPDLRRQRAVCTDPPPGRPLVLAQPLRVDARLSPGEQTLAIEPEGIGEVVERHAELLHGKQQLGRRDAPYDGLYRRDGLPILESEQACQFVLGDPRACLKALIRVPMS